jgi:phosphoglycerol transferase MdoB-like AlkP superfamily enzyme
MFISRGSSAHAVVFIESLLVRYHIAYKLPLLLGLLLIGEHVVFNAGIGLPIDAAITDLFAATGGLSILLFGPGLLLRGHLRYGYLMLTTLIAGIVLSGQDLYFAYAQGFLQASALSYADQAVSQLPTALALCSWRIPFYFLPLAIVVVAYAKLFRASRKTAPHSFATILITSIILIALALGCYGVTLVRSDTWEFAKLLHPYTTLRDMNNFVFSPHEAVKRIGIINYSLRDLIGYSFRHAPLSADDIHTTQTWINEKLPKEYHEHYGIARGRNVILIQVESLEASVINASVNGVSVTPHLNTLAREGLYFPNYYALVGPGNTADAEFVTLNSLYPLSNTVAFIDYAHNTYDALPKVLKGNGYHTAVLHDDVPTFWNRSNIYPSLGYTEVKSKNDFIQRGTSIFGHLEDREFLAQSQQHLRNFPHPFMATLITLSSHTPYELPITLRTFPLPSETMLTERQQRYLESINYVDRAIGEFIAELKKSDRYAHSVIVIFGDHGSFTDIEHALATDSFETPDLLRNHVPLIILAPETPLRGTQTNPGSHLDLAPTILNLLGIPEPEHMIGQDLLNAKVPVVTHRDPDSQVITSILTPNLMYQRGVTGHFEAGSCITLPNRATTTIGACAALYDKQFTATRVSDFIVKGDLLPVVTRITH